jgi:putative ABC transport system permease protein
LNETAVARLGFTSAEEALGKHLEFSTTWPARAPIIGVVKDFHLKSLHEKIAPLVIDLGGPNHIAVRIQPEGMSDTIAYITATWKKIYPDFPLSYSFMDDDIDQLYRSEMQMNQLFRIFSVVAVLIACLGLLGLASFTAEQRTREIGVRKVLGASVSNIVRMLSREFVWLVLAANLIAWPLAYYVMNLWLADFAYRIEIGLDTFLDTFVSGGLLALMIAVITVGYQALKAAWTNPVDTLRYE